MAAPADNISTDKFAFSSSVRADVWHPRKNDKAYEWWYFDALSDDGKEAVTIVFLDNFIFSPRYNRSEPPAAAGRFLSEPEAVAKGVLTAPVVSHHPVSETLPPLLRQEGSKSPGSDKRYPAVSFTYFRDGKALYRAVNEYSSASFSASETTPECRIGNSSFHMETTSYGTGYSVSIDISLSGGRRLEASFEWLSIESDFRPESFTHGESLHSWNMVAPRSDVTGKITVFNRKGREVDFRQFRGTGYHDHNLDDRWLARTVRDWHWGRAHFADSTAVFCRYCEIGDDLPSTRLIVIRDGELRERTAHYEEQNYVRDKFGVRYPTRLRLVSEDNMRLRVKPITVIDSNFYYLRFLSEFTLTLRDGVPRKTTGITEFLAPRSLKYRWLNWLNDMRTGKNGKGSLIS